MKKTTLAAGALAFAALALAGCASAPAGPAPTETTTAGSTIRAVGPLDPSCVSDTVTGSQPALTSTTIVGAHATDALPTQARTASIVGRGADIYVESSPGKFSATGYQLSSTMPWAPETAVPAVVTGTHSCGLVEVMIPSQSDDTSIRSASAWVPSEQLAPVAEWQTPRTITVDLSDASLRVAKGDKHELTIGQLVLGGEVATPQGMGYVVSEYSDEEAQPWTQGEPILLTSLHTGSSFAENSGEVGLHYMSPDADAGAGSNGCVRIPTRDGIRSLEENIAPGDLVVVTE
ncbi:hypothetical protein C5B85_10905 [Pseudoclavibacter sp. AY1F1]|uniref:L,D-transpeptidase family protein n=1 Tax=Pseudoclavibacter sp. AY1F1 TaxID=2080583 RepID=UPI000CE73F86|nr:L,D-transpeptidase family protein [Pseudoclavibacter sp. AY1F1]PPF44147.1 hypothetical protein C5B85_10905 [Pseudoclavibacter sp. AY1F1]